MKRSGYIPMIVTLGVIATLWVGLFAFAQPADTMRDVTATAHQQAMPDARRVIWHQPLLNDARPCIDAIKSKQITHVLLQARHPLDGMAAAESRNLDVLKAACDVGGVKVIWTRWLWPGDSRGHNTLPIDSVYSASYYAGFITDLKAEAASHGFAETCINSEPYTYPIVKSWNSREMTAEEYGRVVRAVTIGIAQSGRVDYILPVKLPYPRHTNKALNLLDAVDELGRSGISQHTYDRNPSRIDGDLNAVRPGDVFGVYVIPERPSDDLYKWGVDEIPGGDVYLYPGNDSNAAAVADKLLESVR